MIRDPEPTPCPACGYPVWDRHDQAVLGESCVSLALVEPVHELDELGESGA